MSSFVHKLTLLNRLLDATRECQTRYSTKKEIMTEKNSCVSCVCRQFEDVLSHGIKQKPIVSGIATIQNVTGLQLIDQNVVFWHCIQKHLSRHEVERFNNLYHITTDIGRGRAWLRSSLNEHSLERVFQILLSDPEGLKQHYLSDAILLDEEKASLLPQISAGLKSVMFSIRIDDPALNSYPQTSSNNQTHRRSDSGGATFTLPSLSQVSRILGHEVAMEEFPEAAVQPVGSLQKSEHNNKKRKKKARTKIISFGQNGGQVVERASSVSSIDDKTTSEESKSSPRCTRATQKSTRQKHSQSSYRSHGESLPTSEFDSSLEESRHSQAQTYSVPIEIPHVDAGLSSPSTRMFQSPHQVENSKSKLSDSCSDIYKLSAEVEECTFSDLHNHHDDVNTDSNPTLRLENANTKNLNPSLVESYSDSKIADKLESSLQLKFDSASDISSLNDADAKSIVSTSSSNHFEFNYNLNSDGSILSGNLFTPLNDTDSIVSSSSSLPNAVKYENTPPFCNAESPNVLAPSPLIVEEKTSDSKNGDLQKALVVLLQRKDELVEENEALNELLEAEKQHSASVKDENERLKSKLDDIEHATQIDAKKQLRENDVLRNQLKKYVGAVHALQYGKVPGVSQEGIPGMEEENEEAAVGRENCEAKMFEQKLIEVTEMHGELMEFTESLHTRFLSSLALIHKMHDELIALRGPMPTDNVIRAIEADKPRDSMSSLPSLTRALVNVWVPSAFMQGSGPDSHHVYQVYICVGEDEWNVYRRYSDFYSLHNTLCKSYPEIQNFGFPPKKGIGNRNSKFVEQRRKAFQKYLRLVMHNVFQNNAQLKACPTKETLLHILPFFSDAGDQFRVIVGNHLK